MKTKNYVKNNKCKNENIEPTKEMIANSIDQQVELLAQILIDKILNDIYEKESINDNAA